MSARSQAQSFALVGWLVRRPRWQRIVGAVVLVLFATWSGLQAVAGIVLDRWWFDTVTAAEVWSTIVGAQVLLALAAILVSAAVLGSSVWMPLTGYDDPDPEVSSMVDRYRVRMGPAHRWLMIGFAVFLVLRIGLTAMDQWQVWLLYRHGDSLGRPIPEVGGDLGFYLFRLPFLTVVSGWLRQLVLAGLGLAAFGYAFAGHLHLPVSGRRSNRRAVTHLAVLGAVFAVLQALDYVLVRRPAYAVDDRGAFHGPGYTDITVGIPATWLLAVVALVAGVTLVFAARRGRWRVALVVLGAWALLHLMAVTVVPALVERFVVQPAEAAHELPHIGHNLDATRAAYGLEAVDMTIAPVEDGLTEPLDDAVAENLTRVPLFEADQLIDTLQVLQGTQGDQDHGCRSRPLRHRRCGPAGAGGGAELQPHRPPRGRMGADPPRVHPRRRRGGGARRRSGPGRPSRC